MRLNLARTLVIAATLAMSGLGTQAQDQQGGRSPRDGGFGAPPPQGAGGSGGPGRQGRPGGPGGPGGRGMRPGGAGDPGDAGPRERQPPPPDWEPSAELVGSVRSSEPGFAALLDRLKTSDPERWRGELWHVSQEARLVAGMKEHGETARAERMGNMGRLERKVRSLVEGIGKEKPTAAQLTSLRGALGQLFDLREDMRREEITDLEKRITELKTGLADRRASKTEIVDRRLKELLSESDPLGW